MNEEPANADPHLYVKITLQKLSVLCTVVEAGTVTRAAELLFVAQPVVTAHLHSLEMRLGVKIFERDGRRLKLTSAGERVHEWAAETLATGAGMIESIERHRAGRMGSVRVGASMSIGSYRLPSILAAFRRDSPDVDISLYVSNPETAIHGVEQGSLDFAVVVLEESVGPVLLAEPLGVEDLVVVAAPGAATPESELSLADLQLLPFVGSPRGSIQRGLLDRVLVQAGLPRSQATIEFTHPEAIKTAVMTGIGVATLFRSSVEHELSAGLLREVKLIDATLGVPIYCVRRVDRELSPTQRRLRLLIAKSLGGA